MKKKILIIFLVLVSVKCIAQEFVRNSVQSSLFSYNQIDTSQYQFHFETRIDDSHIVAFSNAIDIVGDTLEVKMFYDITEMIFSIDNTILYNNTVSYNQSLPENIHYLKMSTNVIMVEDNPPYNPITIEDVYFRFFDISNLNTQTNNFENSVSIYPNPTNGLVTFKNNTDHIKSVEVYNNLGQLVKNFYQMDGNVLNLESLTNGIYFIKIYAENSELTKKIVVRK